MGNKYTTDDLNRSLEYDGYYDSLLLSCARKLTCRDVPASSQTLYDFLSGHVSAAIKNQERHERRVKSVESAFDFSK